MDIINNLPDDVVKKASIINIIGNTVIVENFKAIMDYKNEYIKIKAKDRIIAISGNNLVVEYYNREVIKIVGKISDVVFEVNNE